MVIKTWRNPYETGVNLTTPKEINIEEGLTVLVGCNGAGKSTLLNNIKEVCKDENIPCHSYDNLNDGGNSNVLSAVLAGMGEIGDDMSLGASMWTASEGEAIKLNIGRESRLYKEFFTSGYYKNRIHKISMCFSEKEEEKEIIDKRRVLLYDAVDSGLSIDSIIEIKVLFEEMLKDAKEIGIELYLIIVANEYELARGSKCFDVNKGKYIEFKDYEAYRNFIIASRKWKEKRILKENEHYRKQQEKERIRKEKAELKYLPLIEKIENKAKEENRKLTWGEESQIRDYRRRIKGETW